MKIKTVDDYLDWMQIIYPDLKRSDLKRILNYGWRQFYYLNSCGGDIFTQDEEGFWMYCGHLTHDSLLHANNYINKLVTKLRILYKRKKISWDGYYYFALTDTQYDNYLSLKHKRGRPKKNFLYGDITLYKILDECKLRNFTKKYIFRVPYIEEFGLKLLQKNYISDKAELILIREPLKFKDLLVSNFKYEYINGKGSN